MLEIIYSVLSPLHKMQQQALRSHAAVDTKIVHAVLQGKHYGRLGRFSTSLYCLLVAQKPTRPSNKIGAKHRKNACEKILQRFCSRASKRPAEQWSWTRD